MSRAWWLALLFVANAGVAVALWVTGGSLAHAGDVPGALAAAGRGAGMLGAYLALVQLLLLARLPVLERLAGFDRLTVWHRRNGQAALALIGAHFALILAAYAAGDGIGPVAELGRLIRHYPGVITALAALVLLVAVVASSLGAVRRGGGSRLGFRTGSGAGSGAGSAAARSSSRRRT